MNQILPATNRETRRNVDKIARKYHLTFWEAYDKIYGTKYEMLRKAFEAGPTTPSEDNNQPEEPSTTIEDNKPIIE